ncbi:hypothetical protein [Nonomuraea jiangxiensis]|uniref:D-mannose binding lectin n=1 Tax=Nonomuraea jiangxiensis TaxID=633440 RepID=A0A1G9HHT5_9ACTN|nr:hypothetical protein [Nonomuraea jiangxiensis]SDL12571.1 D-mannose binding lectin [Nonomuraea jiangxiensis]
MNIIKSVTVLAGALVAATSVAVSASAAVGGDHHGGFVPVRVSTAAPQADVLASGQTLKAGQSLRSRDKRFQLVQQADGNLVLYRGKKALWSTAAPGAGAYSVMQADGNLVVYSKSHTPLWQSNTGGHPGSQLAVQNDGNLVIYGADRKSLWSRHQAYGELAAGQKLTPGEGVRSASGAYTLLQQKDGGLVLYRNGNEAIWSSGTTGPNVYAIMQADGNLVQYQGNRAVWSTGTGANPGATLAVQNDGNLVIYTTDHRAIWASRK